MAATVGYADALVVGLCGLSDWQAARYWHAFRRIGAVVTTVDSIDRPGEHGPGVLMISLDHRQGRRQLRRAGHLGHRRLVAIAGELTRADQRTLFEQGVAAALDASYPPDTVVTIVSLVAAGLSVIPTALLKHEPLSPGEADLLTQLRSARSIRELAKDSCCSERSMYRRLRELYDKLGVTGRREAIRLTRSPLADR